MSSPRRLLPAWKHRIILQGDWSRSTDSNREPAAYKAAALPLRYCGTFPPAAISRQDGPCRVHRRRKVTGGQRRFLFETTDTEANRIPLALGHAAVYCAAGIRTVPKCDSRSPQRRSHPRHRGRFPAAPADSVELAAECSSVRNGRLGNDSADLTFLYTHSAVISI